MQTWRDCRGLEHAFWRSYQKEPHTNLQEQQTCKGRTWFSKIVQTNSDTPFEGHIIPAHIPCGKRWDLPKCVDILFMNLEFPRLLKWREISWTLENMYWASESSIEKQVVCLWVAFACVALWNMFLFLSKPIYLLYEKYPKSICTFST